MQRHFFILCVSLMTSTSQSSPVRRAVVFLNEVPSGSQMNEKLQRQIQEIEINVEAEKLKNEKPSDPVVSESFTINQSANTLATLLQPFIQRIQFSPQAFLQDRFRELKEALKYFKNVTSQDSRSARQYPVNSGILHLTGLDDHGFYTDRLKPAGFLGGNGWLANKGGLLGGPGIILSTGSLWTDYPTPY